MFAATIKYGKFLTIEQGKLISRLSYAESNIQKPFRPFIWTRNAAHLNWLDFPSVEECAKTNKYLEKFVKRN